MEDGERPIGTSKDARASPDEVSHVLRLGKLGGGAGRSGGGLHGWREGPKTAATTSTAPEGVRRDFSCVLTSASPDKKGERSRTG